MIKRELCVCGHGKDLHRNEKDKGLEFECALCTDCNGFELDLVDFINYINHEIDRRAKQIREYAEYMDKVLKENVPTVKPSAQRKHDSEHHAIKTFDGLDLQCEEQGWCIHAGGCAYSKYHGGDYPDIEVKLHPQSIIKIHCPSYETDRDIFICPYCHTRAKVIDGKCGECGELRKRTVAVSTMKDPDERRD